MKSYLFLLIVGESMKKVYSWSGGKIIEITLNDYDDWLISLKKEFTLNYKNAEKSHMIGNRWENLYLDIEAIPSARIPIRLGRDIARELLDISSVILYKALEGAETSNPPFWFNLAKPGESTGLHDHAYLSKVSGVFYISCESNSGNLYFHKKGEVDLEIMPQAGKLVLFEPWMPHGVRKNCSERERLSMAFNLFPFPLPIINL